MEKYITALENISYGDWIKLKTAVDRKFEQQKGEFEKGLKLTDVEIVYKLIRSQFG